MAARAGAVSATLSSCSSTPPRSMSALDPAPLATEALRGEGATLVNRLGERFMTAHRSDAPSWRRAMSSPAPCSPRSPRAAAPSSIAATAIGERFPDAFPTVYGSCRKAGIDPCTELIPVAPAAHYHMGGIATDARGRTSVAGPVGRRRSCLDRACTAPTGSPPTRCSKRWCSPRAQPPTSPISTATSDAVAAHRCCKRVADHVADHAARARPPSHGCGAR